MGKETLHFSDLDCPSPDISAYIDGELEPAAEMALEEHVFGCKKCLTELNYQKQFLCELNLSLKRHEDIELPPDFAETVVIKAESSVSGLRRPRERYNALFVCSALVLLLIFALRFDAASMFPGASDAFEKAAAVVGFVFRLFSSFVTGIGAILRTLGGRLLMPGAISFVFVGVFVLGVLVFRRMLLRLRRT